MAAIFEVKGSFVNLYIESLKIFFLIFCNMEVFSVILFLYPEEFWGVGRWKKCRIGEV